MVSRNVQQQLCESVEASPGLDGAYRSDMTDVNKKLILFLAFLILHAENPFIITSIF